MATTWHVLDIRNGKCTVGFLTLDGEDRPRWYSEPVLSVYKTPDLQDSTAQADLAFFRKPKAGIWSPIQRSALSSLPDDCDRIHSLLSRPSSELPDLLPLTLYPLLREAIEKYADAGLALLLLVDRAEVYVLLKDSPLVAHREAKVSVVSERWGDVAGFALLGSTPGPLPSNGSSWLCQTDEPDATWRYTWMGNRFDRSKIRRPSTSQEIPQWGSVAELEQVGAALFAISWEAVLVELVQVEIDSLRVEIEEQLLTRLRKVYSHVSQR